MPAPRPRIVHPAPGARPPAVERILAAARPRLGAAVDAGALLDAAREAQAHERERLGTGDAARSAEALADEVVERLGSFADPAGAGLVTVINATGVIVHTNLGRAAWPTVAIEAAGRAAAGPVLLELDRDSGRRGARFRAAEEHLIALTGAEDALVTNNNAAALALAVGLARRGGVLVSRGELVEIGGGVRIPEIVRRAGARLVEVGTTNRTRASDFEAPLAEGRATLILRVHRSNFRQAGFVEDPDVHALAELARRFGTPLVDDLGSGALLDTAAFGLDHEPTPRERLAAGADLVTFSGDKLVGGPQAGLIVGRADLVARIRRDPLARAMRPDKVTLAAVAATLGVYRAGRARTDIPVWRAIAADPDALRERATALADRLSATGADVDTIDVRATVGGGALPGETLPSVAVRIRDRSAARLAERLRRGDPCVIGRIEDDALLLDLRAVEPASDEPLASAVAAALTRGRSPTPSG
jgi:L-seryl-tRNA(Ser) seleniumtransferase